MNKNYLIIILAILLIFSIVNNLLMYYRNSDNYALTFNKLRKKVKNNVDSSVFIYFYDTDESKQKLIDLNKDLPYKVKSYQYHNKDIEFDMGDIYRIQNLLD